MPVRSFEDLRWLLARGAGTKRRAWLSSPHRAPPSAPCLPLQDIDTRNADHRLMQLIGITGPWTPPLVGELMAGGAGERSGLQAGDVVLRIGATDVVDGAQLRALIRASVQAGSRWRRPGDRARGQVLELQVLPEVQQEHGETIARIGAYVGGRPQFETVQYGPLEGVLKGRAHLEVSCSRCA
jgi:regulator of sigma E protease